MNPLLYPPELRKHSIKTIAYVITISPDLRLVSIWVSILSSNRPTTCLLCDGNRCKYRIDEEERDEVVLGCSHIIIDSYDGGENSGLLVGAASVIIRHFSKRRLPA